MKIYFIILIFLLSISFVQAITFQEDTKFKINNNFEMIVKDNVSFDSFDIVENGFYINNNKIEFYSEGGKTQIIIEEWDSIKDNYICFNTSVNQVLSFYIENGNYYFYDGESNNKEKIEVKGKSCGGFIEYELKEVLKDSTSKTVNESKYWLTNNFISIEYDKNYKDGILYTKTVDINNLTLILSIITIFFLVILLKLGGRL